MPNTIVATRFICQTQHSTMLCPSLRGRGDEALLQLLKNQLLRLWSQTVLLGNLLCDLLCGLSLIYHALLHHLCVYLNLSLECRPTGLRLLVLVKVLLCVPLGLLRVFFVDDDEPLSPWSWTCDACARSTRPPPGRASAARWSRPAPNSLRATWPSPRILSPSRANSGG